MDGAERNIYFMFRNTDIEYVVISSSYFTTFCCIRNLLSMWRKDSGILMYLYNRHQNIKVDYSLPLGAN